MFSPGHNEVGGAPQRSRLLVAGLAQRGWKVRVITRARNLRTLRVRRTSNLAVLEVPGFGSARLDTALFLACAVTVGTAWGFRANAFLSIQLVAPSIAAACSAWITRRPFVAMATTSGHGGEAAYLLEQDLVPRGKWSPRAYRLDQQVRRCLLKRAAFLVAQTDRAAEELAPVSHSGHVVVVPTPVELVDPPPLDNLPRAVFTGRFDRGKDLVRLLQAWREVVDRLPEAHLTLVGRGAKEETVEAELRQAVAEDATLAKTVTFTGWIDNVTDVLVRSDVFVFPSLTEGMSNALLEACAWGRVVVASDIPANRTVLGEDYPFLFPPGDSEALIAALLRAFKHEPTRAAARAAVGERARLFSLERVTELLEQVLLAASNVPRGPRRASTAFRTRANAWAPAAESQGGSRRRHSRQIQTGD